MALPWAGFLRRFQGRDRESDGDDLSELGAVYSAPNSVFAYPRICVTASRARNNQSLNKGYSTRMICAISRALLKFRVTGCEYLEKP